VTTSTITVSSKVWSRWEKLWRGDDRKPSISLELVTDAELEATLPLVEEACHEAIAARESSVAPPAEWRVGVCRVAPMERGILIHVSDGPDDFQGLVGLIRQALERRGVHGTIDLLKDGKARNPPETMPLVECRLRVRGQSHGQAGRWLRWASDPSAVTKLVHEGASWCTAHERYSEASIQIALMPRVRVELDARLQDLLNDAMARAGVLSFSLATSSGDQWRIMVVSPEQGRVSLIAADAAAAGTLRSEDWLAIVGEFKDFLCRNHQLLVYGFVKHGSDVTAASLGRSLVNDWPAREGFDPNINRQGAYEDRYAPDAFALQLLGPGYAGRLPQGRSWTCLPLADGDAMLEHGRPALWFGTPFAPVGGANAARRLFAPPDVLVAARRSFAKILFRDEFATRTGP
jgi:hypothetical protein